MAENTADGAAGSSPDLESVSVTLTADDPERPNPVFYVLRRFRGTSTTPYRTERSAARTSMSPRGPGPSNPCQICKGTDHFARTCQQFQDYQQQRPINSHLTDDDFASPLLKDDGAMDVDLPPPVPAQAGANDDPAKAWFIQSIQSVYAISEPTVKTPILDIDTPGDIVGDAWLRNNPQHMTPVMPTSRRFALGHDVPPTVGRTSIRIHTTTTTGCPLELYLPEVTILRHDTVPFLVGLPSHERMCIVIDTPAKAITVGTARAPVQCAIRRSHLVLPVGTRTSPARRPTSSYYIRTEMSLAH